MEFDKKPISTNIYSSHILAGIPTATINQNAIDK